MKPALGPTTNVITHMLVATAVQASNLAASAAVVVVDSVSAPVVVVAVQVTVDESSTPAISRIRQHCGCCWRRRSEQSARDDICTLG